MTNFNLSEIMTTANAYRKAHSLTMSEALRAAWLGAKIEKLDKAIDLLSYCDRFTLEQSESDRNMRNERDSLMAAFQSIIPPVQSANEKFWNDLYALKADLEMDALMNGNMKTYYRIRRMSISEFKEYAKNIGVIAA